MLNTTHDISAENSRKPMKTETKIHLENSSVGGHDDDHDNDDDDDDYNDE
jgi:hypothetical protein